MADYNIISDVSDALVKLLREGLVPGIIPNTEGIGVCSPSDKRSVCYPHSNRRDKGTHHVLGK